MASLQFAVVCCLLLLQTASEFVPSRKLLATSPFLGLATDDAKKTAKDEKIESLKKQKVQSLRRKANGGALRTRDISEETKEYRRFGDFYTAKPESKIKSKSKSVKRRQNELPYSKKNRMADALMKLPITDLFWNMVRNGDLSSAVKDVLTPVLTSSNSVHKNDYWNRIKDKVGADGTLVEFGTGATSVSAAKSDHERTVVAVLTSGNGKDLQVHANLVESHVKSAGQENLNLCRIPISRIFDTVLKLGRDYQVVFKYSLLSDLPSLVGTLLPHEFERLLGTLLSLSWHTFIVGPPMERYFSHWLSLEKLVENAAKIAGVEILYMIEVVGENSHFGSMGSSVQHAKIYHVIVKAVERRIDPYYCAKKVAMEEGDTSICGLFLEDGVATVLFGDGSTALAPVRNASLCLETVLRLNPLSSTLEKLFVSLLKLRYARTHSARNLLVVGASIRELSHEIDEWEPETGEIALAEFADRVAQFLPRIPKKLDAVRKDRSDAKGATKGQEVLSRRTDDSKDEFNLKELEKSLDELVSKVAKDRQELFPDRKTIPKTKKLKPTEAPVKKILKSSKPIASKSKDSDSVLKQKGASLLSKVLKVPEKKPQPNNNNQPLRKRRTGRHLLDLDVRGPLLMEEQAKDPIPVAEPTKKSKESKAPSTSQSKKTDKDEEEGAGAGGDTTTKKEEEKEEEEEEDEVQSPSVLERLELLLERSEASVESGARLFDVEWELVRRDLNSVATEKFSVITYGGSQQGLLATKVARTYPSSTVVVVFPSLYFDVFASHRAMAKNLRLNNTLTFQKDFSPEVVNELNALPDLYRYQFLGIDVFHAVATMDDGYVDYLGKILTLARVTYLEVPYPHQLVTATALLRGKNITRFSAFRGLIIAALESAGVISHAVSVVRNPGGATRAFGGLQLLKITIYQMKRQVNIDCSAYETWLVVERGQDVRIEDTLHKNALLRAEKYVSLAFLLKLDMIPDDRQKLVNAYLTLPVYEDMCPLHIVWNDGELYYSSAMGNKHRWDVLTRLENDAVVETLKGELSKGKGPFSFLEFESRRGEISLPLATAFPESSFISLESEKKLAYVHFENVTKASAFNNVIGVISSSHHLIEKLLESPDFLRYQFVGIYKFLTMIKTMNRKDFNEMLGGLFATAMTSFIQLPSSQILSLATSTFFPLLVQPFSSHESFLRSDHPLPLFENFEIRLAAESAVADVKNNISASVLRASYAPPDVDLAWRLLRVDVRNLTVKVNHHFDYRLDGHSRKYMQHCISNETHSEVYLVREFDGYKIPYQSLYSVSLIALLRMGLLPEIKESFYDMFIRLPLYEDMAPWNIVFQGGKLAYIDYDTKDHTFNKMVPAAYQVMAMLMNYERTVADFGHCQGHGKNEYGFQFISSCVESDFVGPCKDSSKPVPCGDHTCRSTYVECLQALNELEYERSLRLLKTANRKQSDSFTLPTALADISRKGNWVYGFGGLVSTKRKIKVPEYVEPAVSWRKPIINV